MPNDSFENLPLVSVIVPAFNSSQTLSQLLEALNHQNYPPYLVQVIVVDNGSTDATSEVVRSLGHSPLTTERTTVGEARNRGAAASQGEVLAFLDADCIPHSDWLTHGVKSLQQEPCVTGAPYLQPDERNWIHRAWFSQRGRGRREVRFINSGNLFVHRRDFDRIGGFNSQLQSGEDAEFCLRAAQHCRIIADDSVKVVHLGDPRTLIEFCRREIWYGIGAFGTARKLALDKPLLGTAIFAVLTLTQLVTAIICLLSLAPSPLSTQLFVLSSGGVVLLLLATVIYRALQFGNWAQLPRLLVLYYCYYACRALSFYWLATGRRYYHRR